MEILSQLNFARIYTNGKLKLVKEEQWDIQPEGFNNTIRWNMGHVFVSMETLVQKGLPEYEPVHPEWIPLFAPGTKPADWTVAPPSTEDLLSALAEQPARIKAALEGNLDKPLVESMKIGSFHEMANVHAIVQFAVWHEGIHSGIISAMSKINVY
jgi:hypothetical protein